MYAAMLLEFALRALRFIYRRRPPGAIVLGAGVVLRGLAEWLVVIDVAVDGGRAALRFGSTDVPTHWVNVSYGTSHALIVAGAFMLIYGFIANERMRKRKLVLALELRGLIDISDAPLKDAVPAEMVGERKEIIVDIRDHMRAKTDSETQAALDEVHLVPTRLTSEMKGRDRSDISVVVGGLLPVPFLFLTGVLLDDEGSVTLMDWKRHEKRWSELSGMDDGSTFDVAGLDDRLHSADVVVCVSASYRVDLNGVQTTFLNVPVVHLALSTPVPDTLWSESKQARLTKQFLEVIATLAGRGVKRIHLVLATPSSLTLRMGQSYDRRNLPPAIVYQYEQSLVPPYPWGVRMPTHGIAKATLMQPPSLRPVAERQARQEGM